MEVSIARTAVSYFCVLFILLKATVVALRLEQFAEFTGNKARKVGGGAAFVGTESRAYVLQATFKDNTAGSGGAIAAEDIKKLEVGNSSIDLSVEFVGNHALNSGGAIHLKLKAVVRGSYKVRSTLKLVDKQDVLAVQIEKCLFERNAALESEGIASPANVEGFLGDRKRTDGAEARAENRLSTQSMNGVAGRGGALFVELPGMRTGANITFLLYDVKIEANKASVGGKRANFSRMDG